MDNTKPFKTIDEQIQLLKDRQLIIPDNDLDKAKRFLLNNNYYRISGYSLTLRRNNLFKNNTTINTLIQIYEADRRMRHIMLLAAEIIETRLKSLIAYYHTLEHGALGYLETDKYASKVKCFQNLHKAIIDKANNQKEINTSSELFLKHHRDNKNDILPFWVYIELLTISDVSKLFSIIDNKTQLKIASELAFKSQNGNEIIANLLYCVSILRNICAHGGRLYHRLFIRKPWLSSKEKKLLRKENDIEVYDKLFSYILVIKSLITSDEYTIISNHIKQLFIEYPLIEHKHYGFPDNWKEIL